MFYICKCLFDVRPLYFSTRTTSRDGGCLYKFDGNLKNNVEQNSSVASVRVWTNFASLACSRRAPSPPLSLKREAGLFDRDMTARHGGAHARLLTAADCCEAHTQAQRQRERHEEPLQSAAQAASITGDSGGRGGGGVGGVKERS